MKAIKLRGIMSQGLVLAGNYGDDPMPDVALFENLSEPGIGHSKGFHEGDNAAEFLGIVKYEPKLPAHMAARVLGVDLDATHKYDFDNLKKLPTLFNDGEEVVITEKIHGTFIQVGVMPQKLANERYYGGRVIVSSKGMGGKGYVLDHDDPTNLYAQAAKKHGLFDAMIEHFGAVADYHTKPIFICGEVFGKTPTGAGIQDLTYTDDELDFRAFDICVGNRGSELYFEWDRFEKACEKLGVKTAPVLYRGPYSKQVVLDHTEGNTTLSSKKQIREGVVVKSAVEDRNPRFGRKIAKSISDAYLLRKGNVTEFN